MIRLNITTHSGENDIVEVETYDANDMVERLNNNEIHAIAIGDNIYSRIDLKNIKVIEEDNTN